MGKLQVVWAVAGLMAVAACRPKEVQEGRSPGTEAASARQSRPAETQSRGSDATQPAGANLIDAELSLTQRTSTAIPGTDGKLVLTIGDVTRGRVRTGVSGPGGEAVMAVRAMREGTSVRFETVDMVYVLELEVLENNLISEDRATFRLRSRAVNRTSTHVQNELTEQEKIEHLIAKLSRLKQASFIRNGTAHSLEEAQQHLRRKWEGQDDQIETAEDFIREAATGSSISGEPYMIRFPDGSEVRAEVWLREQLALIESSGVL